MTMDGHHLRHLVTALAALLVVLALVATPATPALGDDDDDDDGGETEPEIRPGEVVVKLTPTAPAITDLNADYGTTTERVLLDSARIFLLDTGDAVVGDLVDRLGDDVRVEWAEPNYLGEVAEASPVFAWNDSRPRVLGTSPDPWAQQDAVQRLGLPAAHATGVGDGVRVAVLDTGVQADHPTLAGRLGPGYDLVDDDPVPDDVGNGRDDDGDGLVDEATGHGTHVAGLAALAAPGATLLPYRVLDDEGVGDVVLVAEAVQMAVAAGADVVNSSFGTRAASELLEEVVEDAVEAGAVVVAAAGNDASDRREYPAAFEDAIAVGAVGAADARVGFSNHGPWVLVSAPGESIPSTFPTGRFAAWSGTSMAAPFVAGQVAVLSGVAPDIDTEDLIDVVRSTARPLEDGSASLVDVAASVAAVRSAAPGSTTRMEVDDDDDRDEDEDEDD